MHHASTYIGCVAKHYSSSTDSMSTLVKSMDIPRCTVMGKQCIYISKCNLQDGSQPTCMLGQVHASACRHGCPLLQTHWLLILASIQPCGVGDEHTSALQHYTKDGTWRLPQNGSKNNVKHSVMAQQGRSVVKASRAKANRMSSCVRTHIRRYASTQAMEFCTVKGGVGMSATIEAHAQLEQHGQLEGIIQKPGVLNRQKRGVSILHSRVVSKVNQLANPTAAVLSQLKTSA